LRLHYFSGALQISHISVNRVKCPVSDSAYIFAKQASHGPAHAQILILSGGVFDICRFGPRLQVLSWTFTTTTRNVLRMDVKILIFVENGMVDAIIIFLVAATWSFFGN
jgi:hypothetical protein